MATPITIEQGEAAAENAEYIDLFVESSNYEEVTPDGTLKRTISGMGMDTDALIATTQDALNTYITASSNAADAAALSAQEANDTYNDTLTVQNTTEGYRDEAETFKDSASQSAIDSEESAVRSELYSNLSYNASNYKGAWVDATGAGLLSEVYSHSGSDWQLTEDVTDITLSEPSSSNTSWRLILGELQQVALSIGTTYYNVMYSTDTASAIVGYIYDADNQITYSVPVDAQGKLIDSLTNNVLTTSDTSVYVLPIVSIVTDFIVDVDEFKADPNGVVDSTTAIRNAILYAMTLRTNITSDGNESTVTLTGSGTYVISDQLDFPRFTPDGKFNTGMVYDIASIIIPTWNGVQGEPAILMNLPKGVIKRLKLDCMSSGCAGVISTNGYDQQWNYPKIYGFKNFGLKIEAEGGGAGNLTLFEPEVQQLRPENAGFNDRSNFDAICFYLDASDIRVTGGNIAWGGLPLYVAAGTTTNVFRGTHIWDTGKLDGTAPLVDGTIIECHTYSGLWFFDCYFDNGHIDCYGYGIHFSDGCYVNDTVVATVNGPVVRFYSDGATQPQFATINNWTGNFGKVGFYDYNGNSWGGDYSSINAYEPTVAASTNMYKNKRTIYHHDANEECERVQTPGGWFEKVFDIAGVLSKYIVTSAGEHIVRPEANQPLRILSQADTTPNQLRLGSGNVGISENFSGNLDIEVDGGVAWFVENVPSNGGNLVPAADNTTQIGLSSNRVKEIFAVNAIINTSDEREKSELIDIDEVEKLVAMELKANIKKYKWLSSIEKKGEDGARWHFGVGAQTVKSIFEKHGLNGFDYGCLCYDEWEDSPDKDGNIIIKSGNRYGIRPDQLLFFMMSAL